MTQEFVTQRVAELLRQKGFDIPTLYYYRYVGNGRQYKLTNAMAANDWNGSDSLGSWQYSAPTVQAARDWFEDKYGFFIEIGRSIDLNWAYHYSYLILDKTCKYVSMEYKDRGVWNDFPSSYEAANTALEYCLENLI